MILQNPEQQMASNFWDTFSPPVTSGIVGVMLGLLALLAFKVFQDAWKDTGWKVYRATEEAADRAPVDLDQAWDELVQQTFQEPVTPVVVFQPDERETAAVLVDVARERQRQRARYGSNSDLVDGTGPKTAWLLPLSSASALEIEAKLREDYEDFEDETGAPTWVHLVREEVAEAFMETDPVRLREELVQVAALCVSWVEKLDAR